MTGYLDGSSPAECGHARALGKVSLPGALLDHHADLTNPDVLGVRALPQLALRRAVLEQAGVK
jgi:hypothetical protein